MQKDLTGPSIGNDDLFKLEHHSLVVQRSADITLAASAAVQVVAQCPVFWLQLQ